MEVSSTIRRENQSDEFFFFFIFPSNLVNLIISRTTYTHTHAHGHIRRVCFQSDMSDNSPTGYRVYTDQIFARPLLVKIVLVVCRPRPDGNYMYIRVYSCTASPHCITLYTGNLLTSVTPHSTGPARQRYRPPMFSTVFQPRAGKKN